MNCKDVRNLVSRNLDRHHNGDPELSRHLTECDGCRRFAESWEAVQQGLRRRRSAVTPDAGFAARVTARLGPPTDPLVWAASRLVPATLALTLVLGGWAALRTPAPASLADELADGDLMTWVANEVEDGR